MRLLLFPGTTTCDLQSRTGIFEASPFLLILLYSVHFIFSDQILASVPEKGEEFERIADDYQKFIIPGTSIHPLLILQPTRLGLTHWQHPSFFGYFPTACTFEGMIADLYATSACNPGFNVRHQSFCTKCSIARIESRNFAKSFASLEREKYGNTRAY